MREWQLAKKHCKHTWMAIWECYEYLRHFTFIHWQKGLRSKQCDVQLHPTLFVDATSSDVVCTLQGGAHAKGESQLRKYWQRKRKSSTGAVSRFIHSKAPIYAPKKPKPREQGRPQQTVMHCCPFLLQFRCFGFRSHKLIRFSFLSLSDKEANRF